MKLEIEFNDQAKNGLKKNFLLKAIQKTLEKSELSFLSKKNISLNLANVCDQEIKNLNQTYRRKNLVTDVLSFAEYKNKKELEKVQEKKIFLGEIVLCYNDIEKYTKKNKISLKRELAKVVSYGTLHLLGFRHGKKMFEVQESVVRCIK